jgi:hypothetical protein
MMLNRGNSWASPARPVAFPPTFAGGLALSESTTLISNQESIVKRYLKDVLEIEKDLGYL